MARLILRAVKRLRWLLLLLLIALLPLRGAMAGAMPCPPPAALPAMATEHGHDHGDARAHDPAHDEAGATQDGCNLCAAICALPPAPQPQHQVTLGVQRGAVAFPAVLALAPSHVPGGLERPPRSI